ncbi:hypothetical protein Mal48_20260 [Thalassoglobus polymorphus]|uniref:Uncharacterized protein n=1 Tax=Thalassoglobus polymorphus TaxID=2527994 RepID=A0A517QMB2_9PLAN|nr:hypothetical protein Mal48_20260 [Thalassoglobus polymorphus]
MTSCQPEKDYRRSQIDAVEILAFRLEQQGIVLSEAKSAVQADVFRSLKQFKRRNLKDLVRRTWQCGISDPSHWPL